MAIIFGLRAENSSGMQLLHFSLEDNELGLTLTGDYNKESIQIDFDSLNKQEVNDLIGLLEGYHKKMKGE